jgi:hypothetical protein
MTDTGTPAAQTSIPISPAAVAAIGQLSPENAAVAKDSFLKAGYAPADVAAVFASQVPAQTEAKTIADQRNAETIKSLREQWTGDKNTLEAYVNQLEGNNTMPNSLSPPPDGNYRLDFGHERISVLTTDELAQTTSEMTAMLRSMEVPAGPLGNTLVNALFDAADDFSGLNEVQAAQFKRDQSAMLGSGKAEAIRLAAVACAKMPKETYETLQQHGAFETAQAIQALASAGRAIEYRAKHGGTK